MLFQKKKEKEKLKDSNRKPNKIWVIKGSEFYNGSIKPFLNNNNNNNNNI